MNRLPAVLGAILILAAFPVGAQDPSPTDLNWLRGEVGDGALLYWVRDWGEIYLTELATGQTVKVGDGVKPEFSPDSSKLAWIDGTTAKGRMRKGDGSVHTIATGVSDSGGIHWISDTEVVVVKSGKWRQISLTGDESEVPELTAFGTGGSETDVKLGADGVWSFVDGTTWKTSDGRSGSTGGNCSCSLSPDGKSTTGLQDGHKICKLTQVRSGGVSGQLEWVYDYSGEKGFDNHRWSSNHPDFVVCQDEKYNYVVVMKAGGTYCTRMGDAGTGEMYGDFTAGDGTGDPWPGTADDPVLQLDPGGLTFTGQVGGAGPADRTVTVSNAGGGTLDAVAASESSTWLTVSSSGSGNGQLLSNHVDVTGLAAGSYDAEVSVSCPNATNSPQSYTVALQMSEDPVRNQPPQVDAGADQIVGRNTPIFLDGAVSDDGLPDGILSSIWSKTSGPGGVDFADPSDPKTTATIAEAGDYTLELTADDGEYQASDQMNLVVTERPSIEILSPRGGDVLVIGSTHQIQWTTVNLDDVQIDYSTDGGQNWTNIAGSVDRVNAYWGDYPWKVPDQPSEECLVMIAGYFGEAPTTSEIFAIRTGSGPGLVVEGTCGCGASPSTGLLMGLLLLLIRRFR
jgi:hypothetical protein